MSRCPRAAQNGLYAAITPDLAFLYGRVVSVGWKGRQIQVKIIDSDCGATVNGVCQARRNIDLFADAFSQLDWLGIGVLRYVTVAW